MPSNAIATDILTRVVGYILKKGNFALTSPNLPHRIVVLGEANNANQGALDTDAKEINSAKQAGQLYGYGSPIYSMLRILRPITNEGVGGIPVIVIPQEAAAGATSKRIRITPSGVASANGTHYVRIAGRDGIDGENYTLNILAGETVADISEKIENAVNAVLAAPVDASSTDYEATLETKWRSLTAQELSVTINTGEDDLGLTYVIAQTQAGSGTPTIAAALAQFGNVWNTIVVNGYGLQATVVSALEAFNGIPLDVNPTGRYAGTTFKPFIAITGSLSNDPSATTDAKLNEVTIAVAPAPLSSGFSFEAAANMTYLFARQAQHSPQLDVAGKFYPDMPTPISIGSMATLLNRNTILKKGCSTVDLVSSKYQVQDFVTTYHPIGEEPAQYRYGRNLNLDWNVRYGYFIREQLYVVDRAISTDDAIVTVDGVIKPKQWVAQLNDYADDLERRALIVDSDFMKVSVEVSINNLIPDRLETYFRYKRSGFARQAATTAEAGFNFGDNN